jgi:GMP synthase (glutamine-hydrolysing)
MDKIVVIDFGGQYTHLIARRIRQLGVYSEIAPYKVEFDENDYKGIILSGGPSSVYATNAPKLDVSKFTIPVLGICYGHQLIAQELGGKVDPSTTREYGKTVLYVDNKNTLFKDLSEKEIVWMSHGDKVTDFNRAIVYAHTENTPMAAYSYKNFYGLQFHPEVRHTEHGMQLLSNFAFEICQCKKEWSMGDFIEKSVREIRELVKEDHVLMGVSGGIDSTVAATLIDRAIGDKLHCIFVDHGLLRKNEVEEVMSYLKFENLELIETSNLFLQRLKGIKDPEEKRHIIATTFIEVFEEAAKKLEQKYGKIRFLGQGTIYSDRIESADPSEEASRIKSHHNVVLPDMQFELLEPLKELYKDEVREVARQLKLPWKRHPFPGPGLAARIIGEITEDKIRICREASYIVEEELKRAGFYDHAFMCFAIVGDDLATGVMGDARKLGHIITVRVIQSDDIMTADWMKLPYEVLEKISNRITNEVQNATWVTYTISSKPPACMEPQ